MASAAVVALGAVACTSSGGSAPSSPPVSTPAATLSATVVTPSSPASTAAPSVSTSATPTQTPTKSASTSAGSSSPSPTPTRTGPRACTAAQLKVAGVRGGASQGRETAGVVFTNSSSSTCTMRGYPFAQLRYKGKALGRPATHNPGTIRTVVLKRGAAAQALLTAVTANCQAAISDHARVRAPGSSTSIDVVIQLRGCSLSIDPLEAP